jgi:hypothetical protein
MKGQGRIIIAPDLNVWPHEMETAKALARSGMTVEFIRRSEEYRTTSADVIIDGESWEIKAPTSNKVSAIDKNIRKALHQSKFVIFDSHRMKQLPDSVIERELRKSARVLRSMRRLLFVDRHRSVIDIK